MICGVKENECVVTKTNADYTLCSPGGGSYINEGDAQSPVWAEEFWGEKYERLVDIKRKYDPWGVFFSVSTPGSERWEVRGSSGGGYEGIYTQDGRLCRVDWEGGKDA